MKKKERVKTKDFEYSMDFEYSIGMTGLELIIAWAKNEIKQYEEIIKECEKKIKKSK